MEEREFGLSVEYGVLVRILNESVKEEEKGFPSRSLGYLVPTDGPLLNSLQRIQIFVS